MIKPSTAIFLLMIIGLTVSFGQVNQDPINADDLRKDFKIFRDSLERIHPALYRYRSKSEMNHLLDSSYASVKEGMTEVQLFMTLRFLLRAVGDGHASCNLPRELIRNQFQNAKVFPLRLWFIKEKAFVYCDADEKFHAGQEITSIDNKPINEIRKTLFQYVLSDGNIQSSKYWNFNGSEPNFQFLYYWLYGDQSEFKISYATKSGIVHNAIIEAAVLKNNNCFMNNRLTENFLSLDFKSNNTAILTIKTFDMNRLNQEDIYFKNFLDSAFTGNQRKECKEANN
ncbi:MAG: hypothetical protein ICV66_10340 [Chitinophagaceae bacterium]|nr:hypothetical protein [Chitinophagaceae bacterium]